MTRDPLTVVGSGEMPTVGDASGDSGQRLADSDTR